MSSVSCTHDELEAAVLQLAATARWPDGSVLLDLDETVFRAVLMPELLAVLTGPAVVCPVLT